MLKTEHYRRYIQNFSLDKVVVGAYYDAEMQRRIHRFKFVHNYVDNVYFWEIFAHMEEEFPYIPDVIVYPPVSLRDRIFRGPNHAKKLAQHFGYKKIPILCPFHKKVFSSHQSRRTKKDRILAGTEYSLDRRFIPQLKGKILLIDDLITTGHTAHTLGKLLKKAGAAEVVGYFLASEKV